MFGLLALKKQQIQLNRRLSEPCQKCMRLTAMMGLMIEPMRKSWSQFLDEPLGAGDTLIGNRSGNTCFVERFNIGHNPGIFGLACGAQRLECLTQDCVEPVRRIALAGEALHPDTIRREKVIQRAVDRFEKSTAISLVLCLVETSGNVIEPAICPRIIAPQHPVMRDKPAHVSADGTGREITRLRSHEPMAQPTT